MEIGSGEDARCELLGGPFGYMVQISLVVICLMVLFIKRWRERPPRPWLIWFYDVSKQAFSSCLQHLANLCFGVWLAKGGSATECGWYFVMYVITGIAAIFLVAVMIAAIERVVDRYSITCLRSGDYGNPPTWRHWIPQLLVWGFVGISEKFITTLVLILPLKSVLGRFAAWLEGPLLSHPHIELVVVMVVTPVIISIFSVWAFDNIMKPRRLKQGPVFSSTGSLLYLSESHTSEHAGPMLAAQPINGHGRATHGPTLDSPPADSLYIPPQRPSAT